MKRTRIGYLIATSGAAVGAVVMMLGGPASGAECNVDFSRACELVAGTECVVAYDSDCSHDDCVVAVNSECDGCAVAAGSDCDPEPTPSPTTPPVVTEILKLLEDGGSN